jgi:alpha-L-fucosidase
VTLRSRCMCPKAAMSAVLAILSLFACQAVGAQQPAPAAFQPNWESIRRHQTPAWFHDAKFGIFIHWGLYSVPAWAPPVGELGKVDWNVWFKNNPYAEWYLNSLRIDGSPTQKHHRETYGKDFDYLDFIPMFNRAVAGWNPDAMAELFSSVGARYVVLTTKHHDGFTLWPSRVRNPHRRPDQQHAARDIVGELTRAVKAKGMRMGLYYSGGLDWSFNSRPIVKVEDVAGTILHTPEYARYADSHWRELIDRYQPSILWNDIGYPQQGDLEQILADYYNRFPDGAINDRFEIRLPGAPRRHHDFVTPEYKKMDDITDFKWETCRGLGYSFGYNQLEGPEHTLGEEALVHLLVDIVSKNGNLLLNVGPKADGTIPEIQQARLRALGKWLAVNGEAIYGTRPWRRAEGTTAEGIGVRFTRKGDALFAILLGTPKGRTVTVRSLAVAPGARVSLLGRPDRINYEAVAGDLKIELPQNLPLAPAHTLKIEPGA